MNKFNTFYKKILGEEMDGMSVGKPEKNTNFTRSVKSKIP